MFLERRILRFNLSNTRSKERERNRTTFYLLLSTDLSPKIRYIAWQRDSPATTTRNLWPRMSAVSCSLRKETSTVARNLVVADASTHRNRDLYRETPPSKRGRLLSRKLPKRDRTRRGVEYKKRRGKGSIDDELPRNEPPPPFLSKRSHEQIGLVSPGLTCPRHKSAVLGE